MGKSNLTLKRNSTTNEWEVYTSFKYAIDSTIYEVPSKFITSLGRNIRFSSPLDYPEAYVVYDHLKQVADDKTAKKVLKRELKKLGCPFFSRLVQSFFS